MEVLCDGRRDPVGVEPASVRFSWAMESEAGAQTQGARWIEVASSQEALVGGQADVWASGRVGGNESLLVPYAGPEAEAAGRPPLRRVFTVRRPVAQALLFVSGLGHYEAYLNGEKVGERFLARGWTDYRRRVLYDAYDVTA